MRQFRFDYELLIDETKIDHEVVLATAFINLITDWSKGNKTRIMRPSLFPKDSSQSGPLKSRPQNISPRELVDQTAIIPFTSLTTLHQISDRGYLDVEEDDGVLELGDGQETKFITDDGDEEQQETYALRRPSTKELARFAESDRITG